MCDVVRINQDLRAGFDAVRAELMGSDYHVSGVKIYQVDRIESEDMLGEIKIIRKKVSFWKALTIILIMWRVIEAVLPGIMDVLSAVWESLWYVM